MSASALVHSAASGSIPAVDAAGDAPSALTGLEQRLLTEPDYRPYCLNCSTMERMTLHERGGRRIMRCETRPETHHGAILMLAKFGIPPRVGCGLEFDIHTGERLTLVQSTAGTERSEVSPNPQVTA